MPFTPFHVGPGIPIKAVAGDSFSLMVFAFVQVALDIEPLVRLLRRDRVMHGFSHTYLGATLIAVLCIVVGKKVCQVLLNLWQPSASDPFFVWLKGSPVITWRAATTGALLGAYSHVFIDSMVHFDMRPLAPFDADNALEGRVSFVAMHLVCVGTGVLGLLGFAMAHAISEHWPRRPPT